MIPSLGQFDRRSSFVGWNSADWNGPLTSNGHAIECSVMLSHVTWIISVSQASTLQLCGPTQDDRMGQG